MKTGSLLIIFVIVFVDLLGFGLILPLLPYYASAYGASPTVVGLLVASYAAASLISSPILGRLSDRYGRRPVLLVSVFGTLVGFLLLGLADPIGRGLAAWLAPSASNRFVLSLLFLARILDGITAGNITVAQAYISDVTDEENRARGLGLIGAAFGLGFIIGPAAGGLLSRAGYHIPAFAAAGVAAFNLIQIALLLPESLTEERRRVLGQVERPPFTLQALRVALRRPVVGPLLHIRFFFGLAFATFQSTFALYAQYRLNLSADVTGYLLTYVGLLAVITQGGLIGPLIRRFSENQLLIPELWLMGFSLLAWAFLSTLPLLLILLIPLAFAGGVLNTILQSALTKAVYRDEIGGILGLAGSLEAASRVIAPAVGGFLIDRFDPGAPGIFSALLIAWTIGFAYRHLLSAKARPVQST